MGSVFLARPAGFSSFCDCAPSDCHIFLPKIRVAWVSLLYPPFDLILIKTFTYFRYKVLTSPKKDETAVHYSDPAMSALVIFGVSKRLPCSMSLAVYGLHILEPKILCRGRDKQKVRIHKNCPAYNILY